MRPGAHCISSWSTSRAPTWPGSSSERGPLPVAAACDYVRQAALGLQHAHERGLVHRDVKPHNLLLADAGPVVKVLDLGLARLHSVEGEESSGTLTETGAVMGTPDYIAPEQALRRTTSTAAPTCTAWAARCTSC